MNTRPLSITIATGPFYPTPPAPTGAVQRIWYDLAHEFASRGHKVTLLACRYDGQSKREQIGSIEIQRRTSLRQSTNVYFDIAKDSWYSLRAAMLLPRADVVVSNAFWFPLFASFSQRRSGRVIVHVARAPKGQLGLYRASLFDVPSDAVRDQILAQARWAQGRVTVVPYPINLKVFSPPADIDAKSRSGGDELTVLYTGRVHPEKGVHLLVAAFSRLQHEFPNTRLRLVGAQRSDEGGGGESYVNSLREAAGNAPLSIDQPIYDRAGLADALRKADLYCYPSLAEKGETFGVAPLEAMATGLAPIVSNLGCFKQFMLDGQTGFIFDHRAPDPVLALTERLRTMLADMNRTRAMGVAAASRALGFSYESVATQHLENFARAIGGTR